MLNVLLAVNIVLALIQLILVMYGVQMRKQYVRKLAIHDQTTKVIGKYTRVYSAIVGNYMYILNDKSGLLKSTHHVAPVLDSESEIDEAINEIKSGGVPPFFSYSDSNQ